MIPKIIHFCWMSGETYPTDIQKCLNSWKKKLPDYQIILWDAKKFDLNTSIWVKEAYKAKKYAFCADYIRLYALYNYGGIYLDSDVEVLRSYDELLNLPYFIGFESKQYFEAATIGSEKNNPFIKRILDYYENRHFINENGEQNITIMPKVMMEVIKDKWEIKLINSLSEFDYSDNVISVFNYDWFSPIDSTGKRYVLRLTNNTYSIHHFASAWVDWKIKLMVKIFGLNSPIRLRLQSMAKKIRNKIKHIHKKNTI